MYMYEDTEFSDCIGTAIGYIKLDEMKKQVDATLGGVSKLHADCLGAACADWLARQRELSQQQITNTPSRDL
eukprot:SAG31_NODE_13059_length_896_cov_0.797992_1_plen_72_part_00